MKHWTLSSIWNGAFESVPPEIIKPRSYLYASDLGTSFVEVWYKLKGTPYTNTFTPANRRKMEMGKMMEATVRLVLKRAGILLKSQQKADYQLPGLLEVHGKLDFVAGGKVNVDQAEQCMQAMVLMFEELEFPRIYQTIAENAFLMVKESAAGNKEVLHSYVYEFKSVSDFVFRLLSTSNKPMTYHYLQNEHYLLAAPKKYGMIGYLSREDGRLLEMPVKNNKESLQLYTAWIEEMSDHARSFTPPPPEPLIVWYEDTCSFAKNTMGVEWCKYLKLIYGFNTPEDYRQHIMPIVERWNRVVRRYATMANMTADNLAAIEDMRKLFPEVDRLLDLARVRRYRMQEVKESEE